MGSESSKEAGGSGLSSFTPAEQEKLRQHFSDITQSKAAKFTQDRFKEWMSGSLPDELVSSLFSVMLHDSSVIHTEKSHTQVTESHFYNCVAGLVSGTIDQKVHMIRHLASSHPSKVLTAMELYQFMKLIYRSYFMAILHKEKTITDQWSLPSPSDDELISLTYLSLNDIFYPDRKSRLTSVEPYKDIPDVTYTDDDMIRWLSTTAPVFISCFSYVFQTVFPVCAQVERPLIPLCFGMGKTEDHCQLLKLSDVLSLNQAVPYKYREKWTLLFDSRRHGESFTNVLRNVRTQNNTVIVVRDTHNYIFGGFSTATWSNHAQFQGSTGDFLFSLRPEVDIYRPSGLNTNYFYLNTGQETFPNGVGMGGQLNFFSLWLADEYGKGHSMAKPLGTTYQSRQLSAEPQFEYADLQVWRCSNIQEDEEAEEAAREKAAEAATSILDKDAGAKAILEMVGRGGHSDGLRESDPTASNPEETEAPHHHTLTG